MKALVFALGIGSLLSPLSAQTTWATISGQVTDVSHAAIPGATVRVENEETQSATQTRTDSNGFYSISFLSAGPYYYTASAAGFREMILDPSPQTGETLHISPVLEIAELEGAVNVSGAASSVQTESASRITEVNALQLRTLPILGRNVYNLISLSPGVLFQQEEFGANGYTGPRDWDLNGKYIINGGVEGANQFLLNNAPVSLTGRWQISPSVDAVQELQVLTNTYDAQFGRTGGGTVITTLRAGSNSWHGDGYEFFQNNLLNANSFDNNKTGVARGRDIAHQYGGTFSGPLRRDGDFVMLSLDGYWQVSPSPVVSDTPPLLLRDGQHFAQYGIQVYDPKTVTACPDKLSQPCYVRTPFPGDVIPASRISPIGQKILSLYPAPNAKGLAQNYNAAGANSHYSYLQPIGRWDHSFSDRDRLYTIFALENGSQRQSANGFPSPADVGDGDVERATQHYVVDWTRIINPGAVADVRLSFGRFTQYFPESSCLNCLSASALGINIPYPPTVSTDRAPHIDLTSYSSIISNTFSWGTENQIDFAPSLTLTRGRHVLHVGFEYAYAGIGQSGPGRANGEFDFTGVWTQKSPGPNALYGNGSGIADLLLGLPSSGYIDYNANSYLRWPYFAGYVQDNFKVRQGLTLSLGLRYDVQVPFTELNNQLDSGFDFNVKNPLSDRIIQDWNDAKTQWDAKNPTIPYPSPPAEIKGGLTTVSSKNRRPYNTDWTDLQPRIGLAWQLAPKTVFRAGAGIFYRSVAQLGANSGFSQRTNYQRSNNGSLTPAGLTGDYSLQTPFPEGIVNPSAATNPLAADLGMSIQFDGRNRPIPRTYEYSAGFQRELPGQMFLAADYSGNITVHAPLSATLNTNAYTVKNFTADTIKYLTTAVNNPFLAALPPGSDLGNSKYLPASALLRPYPAFDSIVENNFPVARYRYDSLQLKLEKRVFDVAPAGVLSFVFAYTFSKSFAADHRLNSWNFSENPIHELSPSDRPQNIALAGTWDLPVGWGRRYFSKTHPAVAALINSWSAEWLYTYVSGAPVTQPSGIFLCGSYKAPGGQTAAHWFNNDRGCYQNIGQYAVRTTPDVFPNIRTPTAGQLNLSVEKTIWLSDRHTLQLRGEAYNLTNTPVFPGPNTDRSDSRFGQLPLTQANYPRFIQIALKFAF